MLDSDAGSPIAAPVRKPLPDRRPSITVPQALGPMEFSTTISFYPDTGLPGEVFADGQKEGSVMAHLLSDACVVVSIALQHGIPPEALAKSLGRAVGWDWKTGKEADGGPASVIGVICEKLVTPFPEDQAEEGAA
mgnify:FL=1